MCFSPFVFDLLFEISENGCWLNGIIYGWSLKLILFYMKLFRGSRNNLFCDTIFAWHFCLLVLCTASCFSGCLKGMVGQDTILNVWKAEGNGTVSNQWFLVCFWFKADKLRVKLVHILNYDMKKISMNHRTASPRLTPHCLKSFATEIWLWKLFNWISLHIDRFLIMLY